MSQDPIEEFLDEQSTEEHELQVEEEAAAEKKRGKYFKTYSEEDLQKAIAEVKSENMTAYGAAKKYSIPIATIVKRAKGKTTNAHGRQPVLSAETEKSLVDWIVSCAKMGDPRIKDQVLKAAADCAKVSSVEGFKKELPSSRWLDGFLKRNPTVSFRTPSSLTRASANVSKSNVVDFITNTLEQLKDMLKEDFEAIENDPKAWGNSDETNFELNPVPPKVLAKKGAKKIDRKNDREERKRQNAILVSIKKEKAEERKAKKRKNGDETLQKQVQPTTDAPEEIVKPKRGRPAKSSTPSSATNIVKPVKPVAKRYPKKK